jgi:Protein of unknown function (DUF4238)
MRPSIRLSRDRPAPVVRFPTWPTRHPSRSSSVTSASLSRPARPCPRRTPAATTTSRASCSPRWATPQNRKGKLAALTVATGHAAMTKPDHVAFLPELYTLNADDGGLDRKIETFMSVIEQHAADPTKRLGAAPESITDEDRWTVAFFLALQQGRTPPGLADHERLAVAAAKEFLRARRARLDDFEAVATAYRRRIKPAASDDEIRAFAKEQKQAMLDPDGPVQPAPEAAFQSLALNVSRIALTVAALDWTLLKSEACRLRRPSAPGRGRPSAGAV